MNTAKQLPLFALSVPVLRMVTPHDVTDFRTVSCRHAVDSGCDHCDPAGAGYTEEELWELAGEAE